MWGKILQAVLAMASGSGIGFTTVLQWFLTHTANIQQAIADYQAKKDWQTVIADLFAQMKAFASSKRGAKMACDHETCCKAFCTGVGQALVEYHSGDENGPDNALKHLADAVIALAAECEIPDDPCEPCTDDEIDQCEAIASGKKP